MPALVGTNRHTHPCLALSVLAPGLHDPELYYLTASLRYLQHALRALPDVGMAVLQLAFSSTGSPYKVSGPGPALKALLLRKSWTIHASAVLTGPGNARVALRTALSKDLVEALQSAWSHKVQAAVSARNGLAGAAFLTRSPHVRPEGPCVAQNRALSNRSIQGFVVSRFLSCLPLVRL